MITKHLMIKLVSITGVFTLVIVAAYIWLLPTFFNGYKTYSIFTIGTFGAGIWGYYYSFKLLDRLDGKIAKYTLPVFYGFAVGILVAFLSLLIILNVRGT